MVYWLQLKEVLTVKVLGFVGCVLSIWGLIWGVFFPAFVWLAFAGLVIMGISCIFLEEN